MIIWKLKIKKELANNRDFERCKIIHIYEYS